jgi:hypothetical protein
MYHSRLQAITEKNVLAGWRASGLYPFNPDKVLTQIPKPVATLTVPVIKPAEIDLYSQDEVLQTPTSPTSLTTFHIRLRENA